MYSLSRSDDLRPSVSRIQRPVGHGVVRGAYPEQERENRSKLDEYAERLFAPILRRQKIRGSRIDDFAARVGSRSEGLKSASSDEILERIQSLRMALVREGFSDENVIASFSLVREMADRVLGTPHYDTQLEAGRVLLSGMVAEMGTGEGKTLSATLPAITVALAGVTVHVVTVNDYLARRDAESLRSLYEAFGLQVGVIVSGMDPADRRAAYASDVVYCTNKEVAFDYLKDRISLQGHPSRQRLRIERIVRGIGRIDGLIHRGLYFGIIDEADSVLVDEARTPLIISGPNEDSGKEEFFATSLGLARMLDQGVHFEIEPAERQVYLTDEGRIRLEEAVRELPGLWQGPRRREEWVRQGLSALHLYQRDQHYFVRDDKVQIIDEYTGRVMEDRSWEHGLHQLVEMKEGVPLSGQQDTLARISYQRFFSRYLRLAGMTGTAHDVRRELWSTYGLAVVSIPPNRPCRREYVGETVLFSEDEKWEAVVRRIVELHEQKCPVLVGTRSLEASERLSALLEGQGIPHQLLNARQDDEEAAIIARAGELGRVTVATNMAGRGTDIILGPGADAAGGLYVLGTERHDSVRIDQQLAGRCARQGDPGSFEYIISLEDELTIMHGGAFGERIKSATAGKDSVTARFLRSLVPRIAQRSAGRLHRRMRRDLQRIDERMESLLAFSGRTD